MTISFIEITVEAKVHTKRNASGGTSEGYTTSVKTIIALHDHITIHQNPEDPDKCIISDNKAAISYYPLESYARIREKLLLITNFR